MAGDIGNASYKEMAILRRVTPLPFWFLVKPHRMFNRDFMVDLIIIFGVTTVITAGFSMTVFL